MTAHKAVVEPGPVTLDGRQTWAARCDDCETRVGGLERAEARMWADGHDVAVDRAHLALRKRDRVTITREELARLQRKAGEGPMVFP